MKALVLAAALAASPSAALACGGLFCDNSQPVVQAAERILFARDGDRVVMHVRLTWAGPPTDFGWLLPVPADVETSLSSEQLFTALDQAYGPVFQLSTEFIDCDDQFFGGAGGAGGGGGQGGGFADAGAAGPDVNILSREQVGPYDRTILQGETVQDLIEWLTTNGYQVPAGAEETLDPYVQMGAAFVAIKLVPGAGSAEVVPLALTFTAPSPAIPLRPTANAANPDMGIIVHVLGDARAVPVNFRHVVINEGAINWQSGGSNYADVVSQAADEAGGRAFATDFAGRQQLAPPAPIPLDRLGDDPSWSTVIENLPFFDADMQRVLATVITSTQPDVTVQELLQCPFCWDAEVATVDGPALIQKIREEINAPREALAGLFEAHPYMTRLYTTMSSAEMDADPIFDTNPDLEDVPNVRTATQYVTCDDTGFRFDEATIETASGLRFTLQDGQNPDVIQRQDGETVRGMDVPAAAIIEQALVAGQSRIVEDRRPTLARRYGAAMPQGSDSGCDGCDVSTGGGPSAALLVIAGLALGRRRRRVG
ncbi:MAG: DUF2330 domain-containing protein [bacterium]